jgi:hypothetical protein
VKKRHGGWRKKSSLLIGTRTQDAASPAHIVLAVQPGE